MLSETDINYKEELAELKAIVSSQQARIERQDNQFKVVNRKLADLRSKLLETQSSLISQEISPAISSIEVLQDASSNVAIYSFGGMQTSLGMPPKEFMRSLQEFDVSQVFLKDFSQCWYHKGLLGHANSLTGIIDFLNEFKATHHHEHIITIGTSAGGYAAIVFGVAMKAKKILSFIPQTCLNKATWKRFKSVSSSHTDLNLLDKEFVDLKTYLEAAPNQSDIHIYYGDQCPVDRRAAEHLGDCDHVSLHPVKGATGHGQAIRLLKKSGKLDAVLLQAVSTVAERAS